MHRNVTYNCRVLFLNKWVIMSYGWSLLQASIHYGQEDTSPKFGWGMPITAPKLEQWLRPLQFFPIVISVVSLLIQRVHVKESWLASFYIVTSIQHNNAYRLPHIISAMDMVMSSKVISGTDSALDPARVAVITWEGAEPHLRAYPLHMFGTHLSPDAGYRWVLALVVVVWCIHVDLIVYLLT